MVQERIKKMRIERGKTQLELARVIGLKTASAYNKKENGKVPFSVEEIKILAVFFDVPIDMICN